MTDQLRTPPPTAGQVLDAQLHLLDRQVLDIVGEPVSAVDDIELSTVEYDTELDPDAPPIITALLNGPLIGTRIFGGRPPSSRLIGISWRNVVEIGVVVRLGVHAESLDVTWVERWLRKHVIGPIPGGRHDPE